MMKAVVSTIMGVILSLYLMYYFFPLLQTNQAMLGSVVNATDPVIVTSNAMGSGFYLVLPFIPIFVGLFILFAYALKRGIYD
jgi:NhaP-type Na+/H+ or K+/H+ antiporter